jgi:PTS system nitrogen regulatory IIA component
MSFGATLRLLRTNAGFTLRDLAERVGVSNAYLSRVENEHDAPPTPDRLAALAEVLGLPSTTLIELADRIAPFASDYLEKNTEARELMLEILRRRPSRMALARIRAFVERELPLPEDQEQAGPTGLFSSDRMVLGLACHELEDAIDVAATRLASGPKVRYLVRAIRARERACPSTRRRARRPHAIVARASQRGRRHSAAALKRIHPTPSRCVADRARCRRLEHVRLLARLARLAEPAAIGESAASRSAAPAARAALPAHDASTATLGPNSGLRKSARQLVVARADRTHAQARSFGAARAALLVAGCGGDEGVADARFRRRQEARARPVAGQTLRQEPRQRRR